MGNNNCYTMYLLPGYMFVLEWVIIKSQFYWYVTVYAAVIYVP